MSEQIGGKEKVSIVLAEYDPRWPEFFQQHANRIRGALEVVALRIEHIGSTSVPGLLAKPIIDILLVVANSAEESSYLPALERVGYELRVREPAENEHRMLRTRNRTAHIHVYSVGCKEIERYLVFRDRLRTHADDHALYAQTKCALAAQDWPEMNAYAVAKTDVIERIIKEGMSSKRSKN